MDSFAYLVGNMEQDANCTDEVKSRMAMGMALMVKITIMWKNKSVNTATKLRPMKALVSLVWPLWYTGVNPRHSEKKNNAFRPSTGWLVDWCLTALSAQTGYIVPCEK